MSGNNRIFVLRAADQSEVIAKGYFSGASDGIQRLEAEWSFLTYARQIGLSCVPQPIAADREALVALHQFVSGRRLTTAEIGRREVLAAADFICSLNDPRYAEYTRNLPSAAEAAFSIEEHFAVVNRRIECLASIEPVQPVDMAALDLVEELAEYWCGVRASILPSAAVQGIDIDRPLPHSERIVSPSDFGFHNILARDDGTLSFVDFEYAGWDDIAKLAADFFFQPAIPVPAALLPLFIERITDGQRNEEMIRKRIELLRPIFGIKWCCILLNRFVPNLAARSRYADPEHDEIQRKGSQLRKARAAFNNLVAMPWHI